jgi:pimeloyl-ACP methyl ester carboxylesterase
MLGGPRASVILMRNAALTFVALVLAVLSPALGWSAPKLQQLTVDAEGHPLALWGREVPAPKGVVLLVHGRTWSALPDFDLQVPGEHRSVMQALNQRGYSAFALDLRGYRAARDVAITLQWLASHKNIIRPNLLGWSNGARVAQLAAQRRPELISSLILYGYPHDAAVPEPIVATAEAPPREVNTRARAVSDFVSPDAISQNVIDAYVAASLSADPIRVDWRELQQFNELDPARVGTPTLLIHGERDPLAPVEAQSHLFTKLGTADRQWVVLPGADHAALIENSQPAFIAAIVAFLERPGVSR